MPKVFGREPALWIASLSALLAVLVGFGLPGINDAVIAALTAFLTAGAAAWTAFHVTPVAPTVFTGVVSTLAVLLGAFGLDFTQTQVSLVAGAAVMLMTLITRGQITPTASPRYDASVSRG